jgi:cytosine/adenosine deaminase-related metal-dependent hydrolase
VHANHASSDELERTARAGATIVHCPGTHAFFARGGPPLQSFDRAGCTVALGTDSLASNEDLDLFRELALLRASAPWLDPARAWAMATVNGARAVGLAGSVGELVPGARADLLALEPVSGGGQAPELESTLEALTSGSCRPGTVVVAGRAVHFGKAPGALPGRTSGRTGS